MSLALSCHPHRKAHQLIYVPIDLCTNAQEFDQLPQFVEHADPFDRMVIAQAMAESYTLVSPDTRFPLYEPHGLKLLWE
jgi:PIN domain nuclease of toxin-antitoxin system